MLLMSVTSALADELLEEIDITTGESGEHNNYRVLGDKGVITVSGDKADDEGMWINNGKKITISSTNGEIITKVVFYLSGEDEYEYEYVNRMIVSSGTVNVDDMDEMTIDNVNATSLEIYSDVVGNTFKIGSVDVYYETKKEFVMDDYVQTAFFDTTNGFNHEGSNISLAGNGEKFTINTSEGVEIGRVDLTFSSNVDGTAINTGNVGEIGGSGTDWSINNVCSSSLTISTSGDIENIRVYYFEMCKEAINGETKEEAFSIAGKESYEGDKITITGTSSEPWGMEINNGESVTITSNGGMISEVNLHFSIYNNQNVQIKSTEGDVSGYNSLNRNIKNVNSSSLTISHPGGLGTSVAIDEVTVRYKEKVAPTFTVDPVKVNGAYWTTFYSNVGNYQAPEGTQVLIAKMDGSSIVMTEIADRIVNKGQGVVLKSKNVSMEGVVMSKTNDYSSDDYSDNKLEGTSVEIPNPNYGSTYVLNWGAKGMGFYKLSSTGKIAANRAYLVYDNAGAGTAQAFFAFDSAVTGVEINKAEDNKQDHKVYDLQGRRVTKPANGLYIVNGKKVIMK